MVRSVGPGLARPYLRLGRQWADMLRHGRTLRKLAPYRRCHKRSPSGHGGKRADARHSTIVVCVETLSPPRELSHWEKEQIQPTLAPSRRLERLRRVDVEEGAIALDGHFRYGFSVPGNQMARADVTIERHEFLEEAPRPEHGIAATALGDGHRDQV